MRSLLLRLFWPKLARAITKLKNQISKVMSFDTDQEVAIIEAATEALGTLQSTKAALAEAKAALEPLQAKNTELQATVQTLTDEDAKVDAAIEKLQAAIPPKDETGGGEPPPNPVV